jgi:hypothetical protein
VAQAVGAPGPRKPSPLLTHETPAHPEWIGGSQHLAKPSVQLPRPGSIELLVAQRNGSFLQRLLALHGSRVCKVERLAGQPTGGISGSLRDTPFEANRSASGTRWNQVQVEPGISLVVEPRLD